MGWSVTDDVAAFLEAAAPVLRAAAAEQSVLLTQVERLRVDGPDGDERAELATWSDADGSVRGAAVRVPPGPVVLGRMPDEAVPALAAVLRPPGRDVVAPEELADAFLTAWTVRTGGRVTAEQRDQLMELGTLEEPVPPAGRALVASFTERGTAIELVDAFFREAGTTWGGDPVRAVDDRLAHGGITLWRDEAGEAVALAGVGRVVEGTARIGPVYTRPQARGRGCGAAVTCAVARQARAVGAERVLLLADPENATSTGLYERLGFRTIAHQRAATLAAA